MNIKQIARKIMFGPEYMQLDYAEQCLEGENTRLEKYLALVNTRLWPLEDQEKVLTRVKNRKQKIEEAAPSLVGA